MNDQERARLQEQYPAWNIHRPPTMTCLVAARLGRPLTQREIYYGLCATLVEDSYELLSEALAHQREIEEAL
ncbi:hypothetical protein [Actinomadura madurae]|uniref:hypothetical protein n=1 Tax=Actinomadura madurae TaxID=1993 RepID=UPI0020D23087|nr:hypothetical protein [Actinomadura madurae]MCP9953855.1 hypothetical protein [Actinomadura madurae]MCP9970604.1 hypothetical protein [Actinomadura madurae]MCP9983076.1 hypothetical protein [Actinomadura madurae]MCQ0005366.1 hypothetical protein [Actinomadura madurae]MCQ0019322.1 hypothetical protein [Actinomadura madurae]